MRRVVTSVALVVAMVGAPVVLTAVPAEATLTQRWERIFSGQNWRSSPAVGDVNGDGVNDVVFGTKEGWVIALDGVSGRDLPGWPQRVSIGGTHPGIEGSPTIADLDRDGTSEIIVGAGLLDRNDRHGGVVAFSRNGAVRWTYVTGDSREGPDGFADAVFATPAVGDVTGDGFPNVVFGSFDHHVHVLDRHGGRVGLFNNKDTIFSSPALFDIDGDRRMEIWIGGDSSGGVAADAPPGGIMRMLELSDGVLVERWRRHVGEIIQSSPALGDITGDGQLEVVFGTGLFYNNAASRHVYAMNAATGADVPGWPVSTDGATWSSPALGDFDNDGVLDVAIGSLGRGTSSKLWAFKGNGQRLWAVDPAQGSGFQSGDITGSPVIADVNGDGQLDVLLTAGQAGFVRHGRTGALVNTFSDVRQHLNSPAVGKFGSEWRVVSASFLSSDGTARAASFRIPTPKKASPWPQFRRNAAHTGAPGPQPCRSSGGYWILDITGEVYNFCQAPFLGSVASLRAGGHNIAPVQARGIVRTPSGKGYWVLDQFGGMFSFGDAKFFGSVPGLRAQDPSIGHADVIDLAPTGTGKGYWLLDSVGGMFSFGDARFFGSVPALRNQGIPVGPVRVVGVASTAKADGYWLVDEIGGLFAFGNARFFGSIPALRNAGVPVGQAVIVAMVPTRTGKGYWMADDQGGLFAFGDAGFFGSLPDLRQKGVPIGSNRIVDMVPTPDGLGYWMVDSEGGIFAFGTAKFHGSLPGIGVQTTAVGMAPSTN